MLRFVGEVIKLGLSGSTHHSKHQRAGGRAKCWQHEFALLSSKH